MASPRQLYRVLVAFALGFVAVLICSPIIWGQRRSLGESVGSPESTVTLGGWVHADYGQSLPSSVAVRLETSEGMIGGEQPANASGYFEFVGLAKTYYRMTVTAAGFQTYQQDLDLRTVGDKLVVNVHLSPAPKSKILAPPASSSFTDNNASKKARKEFEKGERALHNQNVGEAASHFKKAVSEYPCYARAQTDLAITLSEQHEFSDSEAALKKALDCDHDYLDAYNLLGQLYYDEKKYQESATILREGLRRSPESWQFYYQLGADHYALRQYSDAEQEFLKAESFSSGVPTEIHVKLADVYLKQNALEKAYAEMQAYLRAEPQGRFAPRLKTVMQRMEADGVVHPAPPGDSATPTANK